jgi:predicted O-methyltransferase YrrM
MIYFRASKYLNYILLSRHKKGHGIHSPFIFDLVSRVFRNNIDPVSAAVIENIRKKMISDKRVIHIQDLGKGSGALNSDNRKVSDIARHSPVTRKYGELLSKLAKEFGNPLILELGTSLGISTMYLAAACPDSDVWTIEGCPGTAAIAQENFNEATFRNIKLFKGPFDEVLPGIYAEGLIPGLVFIDGNHRKEPVMKYFNQLAERSDAGTVIIIDDIYHSAEMAAAWKEIKKHPGVSVSIDIFRMGIVFFREGINHSDYIIRY